MNQLIGYLRLTRPANIVTAIADILAGIAIAYAGTLFVLPEKQSIILLILSTACLYGGGVVLNDVFDADLDKIERPERPIPSGLISKRSAAALGIILLLLGILFAAFSHHNLLSISTVIAIVIALAATTYDKWAKHNAFLGPLTMGFCRGMNLLNCRNHRDR